MRNGKKKQTKNIEEGIYMTNEDRRLIVEALAEMRELKGEMREFKEHVMGRVEKLEKLNNERAKERIAVLSVCISAAALAISVIVNLIHH